MAIHNAYTVFFKKSRNKEVKKISKLKRFLKKSTKIRNGWMEALAC